MDAELSFIFTKLNAHILTHPNIVKLWKSYLNKKVERLNDSKYNITVSTHSGYEYYINKQIENLNMSITKCNNAIGLMTHIKDFTPETLLTLVTLQTILQSNIT